jgi:hypothetical protein
MVSDFARERLRPLAPGILLALASIAFGFGLGAAFGAAEDDLKDHLQAGAQAVMESVYAGDESQARPVVAKSWTYFKRAHLHANGLGTIALAVRLAGLTAPALGSTSAAKESLAWLAISSSGACVAGLALTLICLIGAIFRPHPD